MRITRAATAWASRSRPSPGWLIRGLRWSDAARQRGQPPPQAHAVGEGMPPPVREPRSVACAQASDVAASAREAGAGLAARASRVLMNSRPRRRVPARVRRRTWSWLQLSCALSVKAHGRRRAKLLLLARRGRWFSRPLSTLARRRLGTFDDGLGRPHHLLEPRPQPQLLQLAGLQARLADGDLAGRQRERLRRAGHDLAAVAADLQREI